MNQIVPISSNAEAYRASTDAAGMCREIVMRTAKNISGRRHVSVEGWEAIAIAHGCAASALDVQRVNDEGMSGFKCVGVVRRMSDGQEISRGEGFLGDDEPMWAKRPVYARRAMTQTRSISRACRSAFAHVVVMIDQGLSTTPAEEMGHDPETGEIVNGGTLSADEAPPPEKIPGITKIKERLRAMQTAGDAPNITLEQFRELKRANREDLKTIRDGNHSWWTGDGGDSEGFAAWMDRRMSELGEEGAVVSGLIQSMKQCETSLSLTNWRAANEDVIDALDGAEGRRFELAWNFHESAIKEMELTHN